MHKPFLVLRDSKEVHWAMHNPFLVLRYSKEILALVALGDHDNGCHKLNKYLWIFCQRMIKVIQKIDQKPFDMRTIVMVDRDDDIIGTS